MTGTQSLVWWGAIFALAASAISWGAGQVEAGELFAAVAFLVLAMRTLLSAFERVGLACRPLPRRAPIAFAAVEITFLLGGAIAFTLVPLPVPGPLRVAAGTFAGQALLAGLGYDPDPSRRRWTRWLLPAVGHGTVLLGTAMLLAPGGAATLPAIAYAAGFAVLTLHAFWTQRLVAGGDRNLNTAAWEVVLLGTVMGAIVLSISGFLKGPVAAGPLGGDPVVAGGLGIAAVALLVLLASPPPAPMRLRARSEALTQMVAHAAAVLLLANLLFFLAVLVLQWSYSVALVTLLALVSMAVLMEWRAVFQDVRRSPVKGAPLSWVEPRPVTVVVAARNEGAGLRESVEQNLKAAWPLRFLLVPAASSTDDTVEVARSLAERHPDRVRVIVGVSGSKAEDLNAAWDHVDTEHVLILDADETLDEGFLPRGFAVLDANPDVGVVQGRKVSKAPDASPLARFVSAERRHSTTLDHPLHAEAHGAAHFAGSGALFRREVPLELGGWRTDTLTEDIEFTIRLHLQNVWRIVYNPRMVVRESDPQTLRDLLRQRARWSRGWAQCCGKHLGRVIARRGGIGRHRAFGLAWLLMMSVSAPLMALFPATLILRVTGFSLLLPLMATLALAAVILPSRLVGYMYAAFRDPVIPIPRTPGRLAELAVHAYAWILFGWLVQFHALYLELSSAPHRWYVTRKRRHADAAASASA